MTKNVISGKLKGFELSYFEAKIATPENTLKEPHIEMGTSNFVKLFTAWESPVNIPLLVC